jgi:hypothetical protein
MIAARRTPFRSLVRTLLVTAALTAGAARLAAADTTVDAFAVPLSSAPQGLGGFQILGVEPTTATVFNLNVSAQAVWNGTINTEVGYDPDKVRQGANLSVARSAPVTSGALQVLWTVTGTLSPFGIGGIDIGTIPLSIDSLSCAPQLAGAVYSCTATSGGVSLVDTPGVPASPYVELALQVTFDVTPEGVITGREIKVGDTVIASNPDLELGASASTESFAMPCNKPVGDAVTYALAPYHWTPATKAVQQPHIRIGLRDPIIGAVKLPALVSLPYGPAITTHPSFNLAGTGHTTAMGTLKANNVLPTIAPFGLFSGTEGTPVAFSASVNSQCPIGSYVWQFSDGTTSFGPAPLRAFGDDGMWNGQLTVTDVTNLSATRSFNVSIANVAPVPHAGPDTSGAWGVPIAFNGQAVDPGTVDQATLVYSWNWGDGTPGTGGASATHVYQNPGNYVATLTVCDDHVCASDSANVLVRKRSTFVAYTGATSGVYSAPATLKASVTDEIGAPVTAALVTFGLAGAPVGSAQTDGAGSAQREVDVMVPAGAYSVTAVYAGSPLYDGNLAGAAFSVSPMSTTLMYTGATSGAPNKTVTLSAYLADALGRPLDGKVVVFTLGVQQAQGTTGAGGASGVAATSLKLAQKNGKYALTSAWTPAGADAAKWTGAATVVPFSLQAK